MKLGHFRIWLLRRRVMERVIMRARELYVRSNNDEG